MEDFTFLIPFIFIPFFILIWSLAIGINALLSGWTRLAGRYHHTPTFTGKKVSMQSARIGWANYNGVLQIGVNESGLYLVPILIFRPFHKPLLIPWYDIRVAPVQRFLFNGVRLTFPTVPGVRIDLYQRTYESLLKPYLEMTDPPADL